MRLEILTKTRIRREKISFAIIKIIIRRYVAMINALPEKDGEGKIKIDPASNYLFSQGLTS